MPRDYRKITVRGHQVGILDLDAALERAAIDFRDKSDEEAARFLVEAMSKKNYIAKPARKHYQEALMREFQRFTGRPVSDSGECFDGLEVLVMGPGCSRCDGLEQSVMDVMAEMNLSGRVEHVRDVKTIAEMGIMGTPALVINGKVHCVGIVPPQSRIKKLLEPFLPK